MTELAPPKPAAPGTSGNAEQGATALVAACIHGQPEAITAIVDSDLEPRALLLATASLAAVLARSLALYGDLSAQQALDLCTSTLE